MGYVLTHLTTYHLNIGVRLKNKYIRVFYLDRTCYAHQFQHMHKVLPLKYNWVLLGHVGICIPRIGMYHVIVHVKLIQDSQCSGNSLKGWSKWHKSMWHTT